MSLNIPANSGKSAKALVNWLKEMLDSTGFTTRISDESFVRPACRKKPAGSVFVKAVVASQPEAHKRKALEQQVETTKTTLVMKAASQIRSEQPSDTQEKLDKKLAPVYGGHSLTPKAFRNGLRGAFREVLGDSAVTAGMGRMADYSSDSSREELKREVKRQKTRAETAEATIAAKDAELAEKDAENARLKAELAELRALAAKSGDKAD